MIDDATPDLVSRRNFLGGAVGLAGVASMGALFGCSSGEPSSVAMAATGEGGAQGGSAAISSRARTIARLARSLLRAGSTASPVAACSTPRAPAITASICTRRRAMPATR